MSELFELAGTLSYYRDQKKKFDEVIKKMNQDIEEVEAQLVALMVQEEMQNFTRDNKQFILTTRTYANAKAGMMPAICDWMKGHELGDMVKESVHPQTLQAWVKEQIEELGALPEELEPLLNVYEKSGISIRKK